MKFARQAINIEALLGPSSAFTTTVVVSDVPDPSFAPVYKIWGARSGDVLTPELLVSLANGTIDLAGMRNAMPEIFAQNEGWRGLREFTDLNVSETDGDTVSLTASSFQVGFDKPVSEIGQPSYQTDDTYSTRERADGAWMIAVTAMLNNGNVAICSGGLGQWDGQMHLAAVWLGASDIDAYGETREWLIATIKGLKPQLDWRIAAVVPQDTLEKYYLADVRYTDSIVTDLWPIIYVNPGTDVTNAMGISAPDRRKDAITFNLEIRSFSDDPEMNNLILEQLATGLMRLLNTKLFRQTTLPSGHIIDLAFLTRIDFGHDTQTWENVCQLAWSANLMTVSMF